MSTRAHDKKRIGILGGTFDPIHRGHLAMAMSAADFTDLDEVRIMPNGTPPHKDGSGIVATPAERLAMTDLAIRDIISEDPKGSVLRSCDYEVRRSEKSYSYETMEHFCEESPDAEFYFIIGEDSLLYLDQWMKPERLTAVCTILVAIRDDSDNSKMQRAIARYEKIFPGSRFEILPMQRIEISSTDIRKRLAAGEDVSDLVTPSVLGYIHDHPDIYHLPQDSFAVKPNCLTGKKGDEKRPAMTREQIREDLRGRLSADRYEHTLSVMYTAAVMAACHGADVSDALTAGLLHDCTKDLSEEQQRALCAREGVTLSAFEQENHRLLHARTGPLKAASRYGITDEDILNAIRYHTTGRAEMSKLEKILFAADFIEPRRKKLPALKKARKLAFTDLDACVGYISNNLYNYLKTTGDPIDPRTKATAEYYKKERY